MIVMNSYCVCRFLNACVYCQVSPRGVVIIMISMILIELFIDFHEHESTAQ